MNQTTYTAWNGDTYLWPPPDGWYLASDLRWWAPATGPEAPAFTDSSDNPLGRSTSVGPEWPAPMPRVLRGTSPSRRQTASPIETSNGAEPALATVGIAVGDQAVGDQAAGDSAVAIHDNNHKPDDPPFRPILSPEPEPTVEELVAETGDDPWATHPGVRSRKTADLERSHGIRTSERTTSKRIPRPPRSQPDQPTLAARMSDPRTLVVLGLIIVLLLMILFGSRAARNDGSATEASLGSESESAAAAFLTTEVDRSMTGDSPTATEAPSAPTTAPLGDAPETNDGAVTVDPVSISQFRNLLAARQIDATDLTDAEVGAFANGSCSYAESSVDADNYAGVRDKVAADVDVADLGQRDIAFAIDAAVAVFCPDQAKRVGL